MFWKMSVTCVFNEKLLLAWTCVFCVRIFFPPLWVVWELFTAATAALLSCRLQCLALSFFSAALTPPWKERGCVCVCEKHTWQKRRPPTLHRPTSEPSHPPASLSPPFHPTFFPSLYPRPRGKRCICVWTRWCHSWQLEVLKLRRMNWKSCLTLFTTDTGTCMWDLNSFL